MLCLFDQLLVHCIYFTFCSQFFVSLFMNLCCPHLPPYHRMVCQKFKFTNILVKMLKLKNIPNSSSSIACSLYHLACYTFNQYYSQAFFFICHLINTLRSLHLILYTLLSILFCFTPTNNLVNQ